MTHCALSQFFGIEETITNLLSSIIIGIDFDISIHNKMFEKINTQHRLADKRGAASVSNDQGKE